MRSFYLFEGMGSFSQKGKVEQVNDEFDRTAGAVIKDMISFGDTEHKSSLWRSKDR